MSQYYEEIIRANDIDVASSQVDFIHESGKLTRFTLDHSIGCQALMTFPGSPYARRSSSVKEILAQWGFGDNKMVHISLNGEMVFIVLSTTIEFSFKSSDWFVKCSMFFHQKRQKLGNSKLRR